MKTTNQPEMPQQRPTVHVSNLPWQATEDSLLALLRTLGFESVISVRIIQDRETGRSRGFGFIEIEDGRLVGELCALLDGRECSGRVLTAMPARPRSPRSR